MFNSIFSRILLSPCINLWSLDIAPASGTYRSSK
jgi:hypothetical protein